TQNAPTSFAATFSGTRRLEPPGVLIYTRGWLIVPSPAVFLIVSRGPETELFQVHVVIVLPIERDWLPAGDVIASHAPPPPPPLVVIWATVPLMVSDPFDTTIFETAFAGGLPSSSVTRIAPTLTCACADTARQRRRLSSRRVFRMFPLLQIDVDGDV